MFSQKEKERRKKNLKVIKVFFRGLSFRCVFIYYIIKFPEEYMTYAMRIVCTIQNRKEEDN